MKTISIFKTTLIATSAALVFSASSFAQEKSATKPTEANVEQSANKAAKEKLNQFNAAETVADIDVGSVESRGAAQARSTGLGAIIAVGAANSDQDVFDTDAKEKMLKI